MSEGREGFVPNPVLASLVGICPIIAVSRSLAEATVYGLGSALCAIALGAVVPPLRSVIADRLHSPVMIALSASFALIYGFCARLFSPPIAAGLWIYLPLLAVGGLSLTTLRRSSPSSDRFGPDGRSRFATVAIESLMFFLTTAIFGAAREIIGLGTLTFPVPGLAPSRLVFTDFAPLRLLISPAGGFIFFGFVIAMYRQVKRVSGRSLP